MVDGTVVVHVNRAIGLRDAAWMVVQTVSVIVDVGKQSACTGDGKGVDPTFPAASSTFEWKCNDEDNLVFRLRATLPLRGVKQLGTAVTNIAEAVRRTKHGPAAFSVLDNKAAQLSKPGPAAFVVVTEQKTCGHLYVRVEFTPALPAASEQGFGGGDTMRQDNFHTSFTDEEPPAVLSPGASATTPDPSPLGGPYPAQPSVSFPFDNDAFGSAAQDEQYNSGTMVPAALSTRCSLADKEAAHVAGVDDEDAPTVVGGFGDNPAFEEEEVPADVAAAAATLPGHGGTAGGAAGGAWNARGV